MPKSKQPQRKKVKCEKCGLYYKDRGEDDYKSGTGFVRTLCWNCGFLWKIVGLYVTAIGQFAEKKNRQVVVSLDNFYIRKLAKFPYAPPKSTKKN